MSTGTAPEPKADPAEGSKTDDGTAAATGGAAGTGTGKDQPVERTFTQTELSAIVAREVAKAKDPETERKAAEFDRIQREQQTEAERSEAARKEAEEKAEQAIRTANLRLTAAELKVQAAAQGVRPEAVELVVATLIGSDELEVDDKGNVRGADAAVKAFIGKNPYLKAPEKKDLPERSGGEFKGGQPSSIDDQIAEAESKGDYKTARALKLRKYEAGKG